VLSEILAIGLLVGLPLIGLIGRRHVLIVLPVLLWPAYYLALDAEVYCCGTGDGWQLLMVAATLFGVASTLVAIAIGRWISARRQRWTI
jgi:hypothetical protein